MVMQFNCLFMIIYNDINIKNIKESFVGEIVL